MQTIYWILKQSSLWTFVAKREKLWLTFICFHLITKKFGKFQLPKQWEFNNQKLSQKLYSWNSMLYWKNVAKCYIIQVLLKLQYFNCYLSWNSNILNVENFKSVTLLTTNYHREHHHFGFSSFTSVNVKRNILLCLLCENMWSELTKLIWTMDLY